jgi:hypothetical protein
MLIAARDAAEFSAELTFDALHVYPERSEGSGD